MVNGAKIDNVRIQEEFLLNLRHESMPKNQSRMVPKIKRNCAVASLVTTLRRTTEKQAAVATKLFGPTTR